MFLKSKKGFALIELLVVIFIISLLAALILAVTSGARARGRDGRRKADIDQIKKAIELYRSSNNGAPPPASNGGGACVGGICGSDGTEPWIAGLSPNYIAAVPSDPSETATQRYKYAISGTDFELDANFEDASNNGLETGDNGNCNTQPTARYETGSDSVAPAFDILPCAN